VHEACNMFYRREAFESVAGFSRDFYMHARPHGRSVFEPVLRWLRHYGLVMQYSGEDTDLGWHVLSKGWEKEYCADALVYHDVRVLTWSSWLIDEGCYAYGAPRLVRKYPEVRNGLFLRYFLGPAQACILMLIIALPLFLLHKAALLFALPYVWLRGSEPTRFWRGWKRAFRFLVYLPRDVATFAILVASSLRHKRLVV
jgi:GT2 family glycosyltransferase